MFYLIIKTLITAITVVVVSEIAKRSSLLAGILASIPLTSFLAFIWLYWDTKDHQKVIELSNSILLMIIPSFAFFIILPIALKLNYSFLLSMTISVIITAIIYWIYVSVLSKYNISL